MNKIIKYLSSISKKNKYTSIFLIFILTINLLQSRWSVNTVLFILCLATTLLFYKKIKDIVDDWYLPVVLFLFYETFRNGAYRLSSYLFDTKPIIEPLIQIEHKLFFFLEKIPNVWIQELLNPVHEMINWFDPILFFFYGMFFWSWIIVAILLWKKDRKIFQKFIYGLLAFSIFDTFIYFLFPSAPPWYASNMGYLPKLERVMWSINYFDGSTSLLVDYKDNLFAAFPSHHAAWPIYTVLVLIKLYGKKMYLLMSIPLIIIFATWYGAEHYVIDSIAGTMVAVFTYLLLFSNKDLPKKTRSFLSRFFSNINIF